MTLQVRLPWPPSANTYYRNIVIKGTPRTLISKEGREYHTTVKGECIAQYIAWKDLSGSVAVTIKAHPPDRRKRDLDNVLKPLLDALTKANVWGDDFQVDELSIKRAEPIKGGRVDVTIELLGGDLFQAA